MVDGQSGKTLGFEVLFEGDGGALSPLARRLADAAEGGPRHVYVEAVKLRVEDVIYYPDVMVSCGPEGEDPLIQESPWGPPTPQPTSAAHRAPREPPTT